MLDYCESNIVNERVSIGGAPYMFTKEERAWHSFKCFCIHVCKSAQVCCLSSCIITTLHNSHGFLLVEDARIVSKA